MGIGFGFQDWGATGAPGWFHNSGEFGIQMCIFLPLSVAFILALRHRWERWKLWLFALMPITAVMSMVASSSRGALIGGLALLVWMMLRSRHRVRATVLAVVTAITVFAVIPQEQKDRLSAMGEDETSIHRITMWKDGIRIANRYPVLGIGFNNWGRFYRRYVDRGLPHNIFIEAWTELGYLGLGAFLALIAATVHLNRGTRRIGRRLGERGRFLYFMAHGLDGALIGLLASGFFVTVLHYPFFWINLAMTVSLHVSARHSAKAWQRRGAGPPARPRTPASMNRPREGAGVGGARR
jgi:O-antigen ligase